VRGKNELVRCRETEWRSYWGLGGLRTCECQAGVHVVPGALGAEQADLVGRARGDGRDGWVDDIEAEFLQNDEYWSGWRLGMEGLLCGRGWRSGWQRKR